MALHVECILSSIVTAFTLSYKGLPALQATAARQTYTAAHYEPYLPLPLCTVIATMHLLVQLIK